MARPKKVENEDLNLESVKKELDSYVKFKVDEEVKKATNKLIRHKSIVIIKKDIFIIILLIVCLLLGYKLYEFSNIDISINKKDQKTSEKSKTASSEETVAEENSFKELNEKYSYLIDNISIDENSNYLDSYYSGDLTDEIKNYIALNNLKDEDIVSEDETIYIDADILRDTNTNLFVSEYQPKAFVYGNLNFKYLSKKGIYIADGNFERINSNIVKQIVAVDEQDDTIIVNVIEGVLKDNKIYNIQNKDYVNDNDKDNLYKYSDKLTKVEYQFKKIDDLYKLEGITTNS